MFSNSTKDKNQSSSSISGSEKSGDQTTVIAKGTTIEGKFRCAENVRLDGTINGEVHVEKRFVMGDTGLVKGNIHAKDAVVKGKINGDIFVSEALQLTESAVIEGNITARTMVVEEGARYNGSCKIGAQAAEKVAS